MSEGARTVPSVGPADALVVAPPAPGPVTEPTPAAPPIVLPEPVLLLPVVLPYVYL